MDPEKQPHKKTTKSPNRIGSGPVSGRFLGSIETQIVGMQYHEATVRPGEKIYLEREPENPYDPNTILVKNASFQPVGYLPREMAVWLAPLLDAGEIWVEGETRRRVSVKYGVLHK